jgi:hypothetical protein
MLIEMIEKNWHVSECNFCDGSKCKLAGKDIVLAGIDSLVMYVTFD